MEKAISFGETSKRMYCLEELSNLISKRDELSEMRKYLYRLKSASDIVPGGLDISHFEDNDLKLKTAEEAAEKDIEFFDSQLCGLFEGYSEEDHEKLVEERKSVISSECVIVATDKDKIYFSKKFYEYAEKSLLEYTFREIFEKPSKVSNNPWYRNTESIISHYLTLSKTALIRNEMELYSISRVLEDVCVSEGFGYNFKLNKLVREPDTSGNTLFG